MNRRQFAQRLGALAVSTSVGSATRVSGTTRPPVVDCHLHCFAGLRDSRFPYHATGPYQPATAATPEQLLRCMAGAGVDHAVVVHPEPYQDDLRYLEHCLRVGRGKLKGVGLLFGDRADTPQRAAALVSRHPGQIVALRIHAYAPERLPRWDHPEDLRRLWRAAADLGLAIQLHLIPRYAPPFEPLLREFAQVPVIIDHLGRPVQGTPEEHEVIVRWSRFEQVVMKLAAIPERHEFPHRDVRPVIRQLTDAYGPERMIYGGGFDPKATGKSYRAHREHVSEFLAHLSDDGRAQIFGGTASRLFGFKAREV